MRISTSLPVLAFAGLLAACGGGDSAAPAESDAASTAEEAVSESAAEVAETPAADAVQGEVLEAGPAVEPAPVPAAQPAAAVAAKVERPANFAICGACHKVEPGQHGIGPSLAGVFGRKAGQASDFEYSLAMKNAGLTWNEATLNRYLENPRGVVPDTTMVFVGEKNAEKRKALIDYLKSL